MDYREMFNVHLMDLQISVNNEQEVFEFVSEKLNKLGYVNEGFLNGISDREKNFPTGLITQNLNIALPHSDPEFIEKPFVFVARLIQPIKVKQMGDNQELDTKDLFFLGIKKPKDQVGLLQSFMNLFMDDTFVDTYINTNMNEDMYQLFINNI